MAGGFTFAPIQVANPLAARAQGEQDRNQNKLLQLQQQLAMTQQGNALAQGQRQQHDAASAEQDALRENVGRAADWALQAPTPEEQQARWGQVVDSFKPQFGDAVEQYRPIEQLPVVAAWAKQGKLAHGAQDPSAVAEWKYFESLSPEKRAEYLRLKRAEQIKEVGGVQSLIGAGGAVKPLGSLEGEADAARVKAQAAAEGRVTGEAAAGAQANLPKAEAQADNMLGVIDGILKDPALPGAVGLKSYAYAFGGLDKPIPGTPEAGFQARVDQLQGQAFLQAFESLKGGGQITEGEGRKATEAIGRLSTAQDEKSFKAALADLRSIVIAAKGRARKQASAPAAGAPAGGAPTRARNPQTGQVLELRNGQWVPVSG